MKTSDRNDVVSTIISAIAEVEDVPPEALPPIGAVVDVGALERFLGSSRGDARAEFRYRGRKIGVAAEGRVTVSEPADDDGPFVSRCNTCGAENRGVHLDAAQAFFADHADRSHAVEIVRTPGEASGQPAPAGETGAGGNRGTD